MSKAWQLVIIGLVGLVLGAALDEGLHALRNRKPRFRNQDSSQLFQQRLRCKSEAEEYEKKFSDSNTSTSSDKIEFSPARHSCVGEFTRISSGHGTEVWVYETVDILTGESLFSGTCVENNPKSNIFCGNGRDMKLRDGQDKALNEALSKEAGQ